MSLKIWSELKEKTMFYLPFYRLLNHVIFRYLSNGRLEYKNVFIFRMSFLGNYGSPVKVQKTHKKAQKHTDREHYQN